MKSEEVTPLWIYNCDLGNQSPRQEVNSAAISDDGSLMVAGTYYYDYENPASASDAVDGDFFIYCFEAKQGDPQKPVPKFSNTRIGRFDSKTAGASAR